MLRKKISILLIGKDSEEPISALSKEDHSGLHLSLTPEKGLLVSDETHSFQFLQFQSTCTADTDVILLCPKNQVELEELCRQVSRQIEGFHPTCVTFDLPWNRFDYSKITTLKFDIIKIYLDCDKDVTILPSLHQIYARRQAYLDQFSAENALTFTRGMHPSARSESPLKHFANSPLRESKIFPTIYSYAFGELWRDPNRAPAKTAPHYVGADGGVTFDFHRGTMEIRPVMPETKSASPAPLPRPTSSS